MIVVVLAVVVLAVGIGFAVGMAGKRGAGTKDEAASGSAAGNPAASSPAAVEVDSEAALEDGALVDYAEAGVLSLADYVGIEVGIEPSEDDVLYAMESVVKKATAEHKAKIKRGDYVCIDFEGSIDGTAVEDLSEEKAVLQVGAYAYADDFEDKLVGRQPGDRVSASVTYDEDNDEEGLAGQTVDYKIQIRGIFDDYYADKFSDGKFPTVKQYVAHLREKLKEENGKPEEAGEEAWGALTEKCKVSEYPGSLVAEEFEIQKQQYADFAEASGVTYEEILQTFNMDEDGLEEMARDVVQERMIAKTIAAKENLVLDDGTYRKYLQEIMVEEDDEDADDGGNEAGDGASDSADKDDASGGQPEKTLDELEREYKEMYGARPKDDMLIQLVKIFIGKNAKLF